MQTSLAQGKIFDSQNLSPTVNFDAQSFLETYRQTYSSVDIDLQYASVSAEAVQKTRQEFLEKEIRTNLEKNPKYSQKDKNLFEKVLEIIKKNMRTRSFLAPLMNFIYIILWKLLIT